VSTLPPRPTPEEVERAMENVLHWDFLHRELLHLRSEVAALRETLTAISRMDTSQTASPGLCAAVIHAMDALEWLEHRQPHLQPEPPQPRTAKQWLETIPCPKWRAAALSNLLQHDSKWPMCWVADTKKPSLHDAVCYGFIWDETPEGMNAWQAVAIACLTNTPLPPCPFGKEGA
jgi:hypothetical protein